MGKPLQGTIHLERICIRAAYKKALRDAQRFPKQQAWNRLHSSMVSNDTNSFWRSWRTLYSKNNSSFPPVVDGLSSRLLSPNPSNSTLKEMLGLTIFKKSKNSTRNSGLFTRTSAPLTEIHVIAKITMSLLRTSSTLSCV